MTATHRTALLRSTCESLRARLLAERRPEGCWIGELSPSALSTATAVSALATVSRDRFAGLIDAGVRWLAEHQNADGGWGDTTDSPSNLAATMLAHAAMVIAGADAAARPAIDRADEWLRRRAGLSCDGRVEAVTGFYGADRTFAVPILMNCALAGAVPWDRIPGLPFELALIPHRWLRLMRIHVVSYALPALIAIGQLLHARRATRNPLARLVRNRSVAPTLDRLAAIQPATGGFIEAVPLTSFVVMSLAANGRAGHAVTAAGVRFLERSVRADGSWPIDSNLSLWLTTQAVLALRAAPGGDALDLAPTLAWIVAHQQRRVHPFTGAAPGGWAWTHLAGGVPDADDTAGALVALSADPREETLDAARRGIRWLIDLQNVDGGWPTFCRGWGKLPFDRSAADLTAHAVRALASWSGRPGVPQVDRPIARGLRYLCAVQGSDGAWLPLWFGNQAVPDQRNPVLGTARVLAAYRDIGRTAEPGVQAALSFLVRARSDDGGWGGAPGLPPTVEETAVAVDALTGWLHDPEIGRACLEGGLWLAARLHGDTLDRPSPLGLYFTKLWYSERLYPVIWSLAALGRLLARRRQEPVCGPSSGVYSGEPS